MAERSPNGNDEGNGGNCRGNAVSSSSPSPSAEEGECGAPPERIRGGAGFSLRDGRGDGEELLDAARHGDVDAVRAALPPVPGVAPTRGGGGDSGDGDALLRLLRYRDPRTGSTALHMASANGHADVVELLLLSAAAAKDPSSSSPSSSAAAVADLVNAENRSGNTALHWAAMNGREEVVGLLLRLSSGGGGGGVDVLRRNGAGRSVLTEGYAGGNDGVVRLLLEHDSASEERLVAVAADAEERPNRNGGGKGEEEAGPEQAAASVTHEFVFGPPDRPVRVKARELAIGGSGGGSSSTTILGQESALEDETGRGIWPSSLVAAQWMADLLLSSSSSSAAEDGAHRHFANNGTVLELGAGCGVPALTVAAAAAAGGDHHHRPGAKVVYVTDFNPVTVDNARHNASLNHHDPRQDEDDGDDKTRVECRVMNWHDPATWPNERIDVLLGSDLIYQPDMVRALLHCVRGLLAKPSGRFLYVAPSTGRCGQDDLFRAAAEEGDFDVTVTDAPDAYTKVNPLQSQDEEDLFLHFSELVQGELTYRLYEFRWKNLVNE